MKRALLILSLLCACLMMGAGWLSGPRFGPGVGPGFAPVVRVGAQADTRVAWNADPDCVYFDTSDDWATAAETGLPFGTAPRTLMLWVKDEEPTGICCLFSYGDYREAYGPGPNEWRNSFSGWFDGTGSLTVSLYYGDIDCSVSRADSWRHYAFVSRTQWVGDIKMYINGSELPFGSYSGGELTASSSFMTMPYAGLRMSYWRNSFYGSTRKIAEFAIFDRALTQSEIQSYYPYKFTGTEDGLIRVYHMDEGTGTECADSKGGYTMTLNGATWGTK